MLLADPMCWWTGLWGDCARGLKSAGRRRSFAAAVIEPVANYSLSQDEWLQGGGSVFGVLTLNNPDGLIAVAWACDLPARNLTFGGT